MRAPFAVLTVCFLCLWFGNAGANAQHTQQPVTVMIDPGHGGIDSGTVSATDNEKDIVLKIALRVKEILDSWGVNALLTRSDDQSLTLKERAHLINNAKPDLCISIHLNSSGQKRVSGFESFVYLPNGKHGYRVHPDGDFVPIHSDYPVKQKTGVPKGYFLAYCLHQRIARRTAARDRGIKFGKYYLLKHVKAPCVLIELGFLSHPAESRRLSSPAYQESCARAIAEGIVIAAFGRLDPEKNQLAAHKPDSVEELLHSYDE